MLTLVVMAAGIGSRFGGNKQLAEVGPDGEAFLDYAVVDAADCGATKVVLVVRSEIESEVRRHVDNVHPVLQSKGVRFAYVRQDENGPPRRKPWGTAHAVLAAAGEVDGPFIVCNADDYYGATSISALAKVAVGLRDNEAGLCGFRLWRTLPADGEVSRGICSVSRGRLVHITEHHGVALRADGTIASAEPAAVLDAETAVSMNLWAFPQTAFDWIGRSFNRFLGAHRDDDSAECLLPAVVAERMAEASLKVRVVRTDEGWVGITNPDDLKLARSALAVSRR